MPYVSSSAISRIEYDDNTRRLFITFQHGETYTYYGVPRHVYDAFLRAASKGRFYNDYIKDRYSV